MARSVTTFDSGNRVGLKLTPELHRQFVAVVQQTGRISVASGMCGLSPSTARHWMARGRNEESGIFREFLDDVDRARSDFLLLANRRLNQMAVGGVMRIPAFYKTGAPIRNHRKGCDTAPGCGCELKFVERVMPPDSRILMWQVDRIDPFPNGSPHLPGLPDEPAELNSAEAIAEAAKYFSLYKEGVQILIDLGCPPRQIAGPKDIETAAAKPAEPEPPAESAAPKKITVPEAF
jgi:hypothetical protein